MRQDQLERGAEAFRDQLAICNVNPEPYVSLALLSSMRGAKDEALEHLRLAVVRGFTDLPRLERSEVWKLSGHPRFRQLQDVAAGILADERDWPEWDRFIAVVPPDDVGGFLREYDVRARTLDGMEPALGERYTRLWHRLEARRAAAMLESYVEANPQADVTPRVLERLMSLYAGPDVLRRFEVLPAGSARRLARVSATALELDPDGPLRAGALVGSALADFAERDRDGRLDKQAAERALAALEEVLDEHIDSPFATTATEGLVRIAWETGRRDVAAAGFDRFRSFHSGTAALAIEIRERLGPLALRVGGLPDFRATALDGTEIETASLVGRITVIDFWATWCPPCLDGMPSLQRIERRFGDEVAVVGISLDHADALTSQTLAEWVRERGVPGLQIYDGDGWESQLVRSFGVREIPFSVVVDADGTVIAVDEHGKTLERTVRSAVKRSQSPDG